jgi:thiol-disulfide isomerase/thioredoxin
MEPDINSSSRRRLLHASLLAIAPLLPLMVAPAAAAEPIRWGDITLLDGRKLTAAELNGSTVVVQMWASWCPFCMRQNPHIQKLHERDGKRLLVLGLTIGKDPQVEREYLAKRGYTFAAAMSPPQADQWFGKRRTLPEVYVVAPGGRLVFKEDGEMFPEDIAALARFAARQ